LVFICVYLCSSVVKKAFDLDLNPALAKQPRAIHAAKAAVPSGPTFPTTVLLVPDA
jgi:hypothetical protein